MGFCFELFLHSINYIIFGIFVTIFVTIIVYNHYKFRKMDVCSPCEESDCDLYFCRDCNKCSKSQSRELLCETCVSVHVKKGHDIRYRHQMGDHVPIICKIHRKMHAHYCKTCDVTFCPHCLEQHTYHHLESIKRRAREVNIEIYMVIYHLIFRETNLKVIKEAFVDIAHHHEGQKMKKMVETKLEELKKSLFTAIDINLETIRLQGEILTNTIEDILSLQQESRNLLKLPKSSLIHEHRFLKQKTEELNKRYEQTESKKYSVTNPETEQLTVVLENCFAEVEEFLKPMLKLLIQGDLCGSKKRFSEIVKTEYQSLEIATREGKDSTGTTKSDRVAANLPSWDKYLLKNFKAAQSFFLYPFKVCFESSYDELAISKLKNIGAKDMHFERKLHREFCEEILSVFLLRSSSELYHLILETFRQCYIIKTVDGSFSNLDVLRQNWLTKLSKPQARLATTVCPYYVNDDVHWCTWNYFDREICFSHDSSVKIKCHQPPKLVSWGYFDQFCLYTCENIILYINAKVGECNKILSPFVEALDHVTILKKMLFVWSKRSRATAVIIKLSGDWVVDRIVSWKYPPKEVTLDPHLSSSNGKKLIPAVYVKRGALCEDDAEKDVDWWDPEILYVFHVG